MRRNRLLLFSGFADHAKRILAAIDRQALMGIERSGNLGFGFSSVRQTGLEARATTLADPKQVRGCFHDAELALCHGSSLPPSRELVDFKRHHYRFSLDKDLHGCR